MSQPTDLPSYIQRPDFQGQQPFLEQLSLVLGQWLNSNGFLLPTLTTAQATNLLTTTGIVLQGRMFYNSDINAMQFIDKTGSIQTITSV